MSELAADLRLRCVAGRPTEWSRGGEDPQTPSGPGLLTKRTRPSPLVVSSSASGDIIGPGCRGAQGMHRCCPCNSLGLVWVELVVDMGLLVHDRPDPSISPEAPRRPIMDVSAHGSRARGALAAIDAGLCEVSGSQPEPGPSPSSHHNPPAGQPLSRDHAVSTSTRGTGQARTLTGRPKAHPTPPGTIGSGTGRRSLHRRRFTRMASTNLEAVTGLAELTDWWGLALLAQG